MGEQNSVREGGRETDSEVRDAGEGECEEIQRKDKTLRHTGWLARGKRTKMKRRNGVRDAFTCERFCKAL